MGYGLIGMGQQQLQDSLSGLDAVTRKEQERNAQQESLDQQYKAAEQQQKTAMAGVGASLGMTAGMAYGASMGAAAGPVGALAGAAAGYMLGEVF